jgi:hypothetical protein
MSFLTGKRSKNRAFEQLNQQLSPLMTQQAQQGQAFQQQGGRFLDAYGGGLGLGDEEAFNTGFERFQGASGYNNIFNEAMRGITSQTASRGLMNSGAAVRAMQDRAGQLGNESYQNYLASILGGAQTGLGAGQSAFGASQGFGGLIAGAGQTGGNQGILGGIGQAAGGAASLIGAISDRRAKKDIQQIGTRPDGLGIYEYTLKDDGQRYIGVMADEVAKHRPEALGAVNADGYRTVHYDRL